LEVRLFLPVEFVQATVEGEPVLAAIERILVLVGVIAATK
jgi:hypothetical protein